jgi:hypothetical protein
MRCQLCSSESTTASNKVQARAAQIAVWRPSLSATCATCNIHFLGHEFFVAIYVLENSHYFL